MSSNPIKIVVIREPSGWPNRSAGEALESSLREKQVAFRSVEADSSEVDDYWGQAKAKRQVTANRPSLFPLLVRLDEDGGFIRLAIRPNTEKVTDYIRDLPRMAEETPEQRSAAVVAGGI